ncbi:peroxide stress protein YaaA [Gemella sp. GH3]|uniref:peroxide stress protein YaaA n=1 Tax=unclassified Gemella TaxID=2624949 RepID=UPI0015D09A8A|nr:MULTISPECIES: peroxide stress protein YaaA [unclassified Gemella]MBF0713406.1 peroxide stress protein YaaA [Gemella sp. GH3.1]NYS50358.1 peroxide stress protein YaaA [Gemella sp. GH3]
MKILIPTAKEMNSKGVQYPFQKLNEKSKEIIREINKFTIDQLSKLYKIKYDSAKVERSRILDLIDERSYSYEAIHLFDGLMYRNMKRDNLLDEEKAYLVSNVFITSSLYGIINVYDKISEHRLDFLQNIKVNNKNLKTYWRNSFDDFVRDEDLVVSLLSSEFEEVFSKEIRENFVKIIFKEEAGNVLKTHSTISKKARGRFVTKLMENNVYTLEQIKQVTFDDYVFREDLSDDNKIIFVARRGD